MKILLALFLLAMCVGCSTTLVRETPQPVRMGDTQVETTSLVEALLARKGTLVQAINGAWRDQTFQAQCVMKGDGESLKVVFLAPQMRLVTITVTRPHAIRYERAPRIPAAFEPEYALADLAFVNLETEPLRRAVGSALQVEDDGTVRRVKTSAGEDVAEVIRNADGTQTFKNLLHGYRYELKTVQ